MVVTIIKDKKDSPLLLPDQFRRASSSSIVSLENRTLSFRFGRGEHRRLAWDWKNYRAVEEEVGFEPGQVNLSRVKNKVCPFLDNHWGSRLGMVKKVELDDKGAIATVKLSRTTDADRLLDDIENDTAPGVSYRYRVRKYEEIRKQTEKKPALLKAILWDLLEVSAVDIPADPGVGFGKKSEDEELHPCVLILDQVKSNKPKIKSKMEITEEELKALQEQAKSAEDAIATAEQVKKENKELSEKLKTQGDQIAGLEGNLAQAKEMGDLKEEALKMQNAGRITKADFDKLFTEGAKADSIKFALDLFRDRESSAPQVNTKGLTDTTLTQESDEQAKAREQAKAYTETRELRRI